MPLFSLTVALVLGQLPTQQPNVTQPQLDELLERIEVLEKRVEQTEETAQHRIPRVTVTGYLDVGFFVPMGNEGSGVIEDVGNRYFPQYAGKYGWVFLGDLYGPMVNSRGEPSDLGSLPGVDRFDSIHSRGAPSFLVNEAHIRLEAGLTPSLLAQVGFNLVPRTGHEFNFGDFFNADVMQLEWIPFDSGKTSIFIGKFESVMGIEYRERRANQRFGITPSLMQRYTSGLPVGIKARSKFLPHDMLVVALSLTNGSSVIEPFHFSSEIDTNWAKTGSGRVSFAPPLPAEVELELGVSGSVGAQDFSRVSSGLMWFLGFDGRITWRDLTIKAQFLRGFSPGSASENVYALSLHGGGYLQAEWMFLPFLGALARGEFRNAEVTLGTERNYVTRGYRFTGGLRFVPNQFVTLKAEYLYNGEYGGVPPIDNNVLTTSLVVTL